MKYLGTIFSFLLISKISLATVCPQPMEQVDLSDGFPPVKDQDSVGLCYAFAAADMLNYQRYTSSDPREESMLTTEGSISPLSVARNFIAAERENFNLDDFISNGGSPYFSLRHSTDAGPNGDSYGRNSYVCTENSLPSFDYSHVPSDGCVGIESGTCGLRNILDPFIATNDYVKSDFTCDLLAAGTYIAPNLPLTELQQILENFEGEQALEQILNHACPESERISIPRNFRISRFQFNNLKVQILNEGRASGEDTNTLMNALNEQLSQGSPVSLSFYSQFLQGQQESINEESPTHAALIIGRQWNRETCSWDYIMRNSWGSDCSYVMNRTLNSESATAQRQCQGNIMTPTQYDSFRQRVESPNYQRTLLFSLTRQPIRSIANSNGIDQNEVSEGSGRQARGLNCLLESDELATFPKDAAKNLFQEYQAWLNTMAQEVDQTLELYLKNHPRKSQTFMRLQEMVNSNQGTNNGTEWIQVLPESCNQVLANSAEYVQRERERVETIEVIEDVNELVSRHVACEEEHPSHNIEPHNPGVQCREDGNLIIPENYIRDYSFGITSLSNN